MQTRPVVIGAGPAGLSAARELAGHKIPSTVLEADPLFVGGLSRTVTHAGHRFDIGGHRFFSKNAEIERLWREWLDEPDWIEVRRLSRILYRQRFFDYPIRPWNAFINLGPVESLLCLFSYFVAQVRPRRPVVSFEDWVSNAFGHRLYRIFFKTYTEKVWGMSCRDLSADWAAQRIRGLSLWNALRAALLPRYSGQRTAKTLVEKFRYPRLGPGMLWERVADSVRDAGGDIRMGATVSRLRQEGGRVVFVEYEAGGSVERVECSHVISSMPLGDLVKAVDPAPPADVLEAAGTLGHRDFLTVALVVDRPQLFDDNWIYVHEPGVLVGRIQNYRNWSAEMVGDARQTVLGLEYFCTRGDDLWARPDDELVQLGTVELEKLGLLHGAHVQGGTVVRMPRAYPVYDDRYSRSVALLRDYLGRECSNVQVVGRNGMHRYNNQDHAMLTGILAARNMLGEGPFDLWKVNSDAVYLEEGEDDDPRPRHGS